MITVTYQYYSTSFGGSLDQTEFNALLPKAQRYLNIYTNDKYGSASEDSLPEGMVKRLKDCTCACIDCLQQNGDATQSIGVITSETVGPWSVHKAINAGGANTASQAFLQTIKFYLAGTSFFCTWC